MSTRPLFLVAYDIRHPRRLSRVLHAVKAYSTGGQKSVHECFLSPGEKRELGRQLCRLIDPGDDSVLLIRPQPRARIRTLGIARSPRDEDYFYIG